ncbi:tissue factor pathway inhibitor a isoform X2 [Pungitius pungitius]|uniref:tissue factor pathway inhibitor a isoform X2 n=1 Tax=Pungitius pungitius TaxID=134920 RepID=UPI002E0EE6B4
MTLSNRRWVLCAVLLSVAAGLGSCRRHRADELFIFNELCALRDEPGPCKALKERFFFSVDTGHCELFEYGGCGGNANNFRTLEECEETCLVSDDKNPCHLPEAPGPCRGLLTRYFFDASRQRCRHFFYGGCFGNANNFNSMSECQAKCHSPAEPSEAPQHTPAAAKPAAAQPTTLTLGERHSPQVQSNVTDEEAEASIPAELCVHPVDRGTCLGAEKRFAFNPKTKRCQMFHYSGCGGNDNNFTRRKSCIKKCIGSRKPFGTGLIRIRKKNLNYLTN